MNVDEQILYSDFKAAMMVAQNIPVADLKIILDKPSVSDRGADHIWRNTCAKYGIVSTPEGKTKDVKQYFRDRRRDQKIEKLEARIKELESQHKQDNMSRALEIARKLRT